MNTTTNGAHVEVTTNALYPSGTTVSCNVDHGGLPCPGLEFLREAADPLYVAPDPCHTTGRIFPSPIVRELLRSLGVTTCPDCFRFTGMAPRVERPMRRKGSGWRERP